ncbi:MAG: Aminomethyltransferase [Phycisphaerae bacterium]|nr:Aminomethyltransferase [Phycisphaerae bacterium]
MSLRTPFCDLHERMGARMVDFAGWRMPLLYSSIIEEHTTCRHHAAIFDISHMGRLILTGPDAEKLVEKVATRKVADQKVGRARYALVCNEQGFALDDILIYRYEEYWLIVCNASNRDKIVAWLNRHVAGLKVQIADRTAETAMIALQGPDVIDMVSTKIYDAGIAGLKRYAFTAGRYMGIEYTISRTGYTGEDGIEAIFPANTAMLIWPYISSLGEDHPLKPAGLGARDTLRLEAAMPLYGHELDEQHDPISAGLSFAVSLDKDFIGRDALAKVAEQGPRQKLVGLSMEGRKAARQGHAVLAAGKVVGVVTSGALSPTLGHPIAMAYVDADKSADGTMLSVDCRGANLDAKVVPLPFYKAAKK